MINARLKILYVYIDKIIQIKNDGLVQGQISIISFAFIANVRVYYDISHPESLSSRERETNFEGTNKDAVTEKPAFERSYFHR